MIRPDPAAASAAAAAHPAPAGARHERLDALRGAAVVWMALFHFCFDLSTFHFTASDFYRDPFWLHQRTAIVSLFLLCAGLSQSVALGQGQSWARFWRRWAQVAGCALLVSLGSWWMFPRSFISFGVLHGMALMLILLRLLGPRLPLALLWPLGLVAVLLPRLVQHPFFDSRWTDWVGLVTHKPVTVDFVPLLPWIGLMLWGYALGRWRPGLLLGPIPAAARPLAVLGRWSLSFYMLHQPLLIGSLWALQATIGA